MNSHLDAPLSSHGRQCKRFHTLLAKRGLHKLRDVLYHIPFRCEDYSRVLPIAQLIQDTHATVQGTIQLISNRRSRRMRRVLTEALVSDMSGSVKVIWFNQPFLTKNLHVGDMVSLSGKTNDHFFDLQLVNPSYEKLVPHASPLHTARCVPIYSLGDGITQKQFHLVVKEVCDACLSEVSEWLPDELCKSEKLMSLREALRVIHFPADPSQWNQGLDRLKWDELFSLQLVHILLRQRLSAEVAHPILCSKNLKDSFLSSLPFVCTKTQLRACHEVLGDMARSHPMNRLLEGDVGCGKTIVAALAALATARVCLSGRQAGLQSIFLAPTDILARQHFSTLCKLFEPFTLRIALLTSSLTRIGNKESGIINKKSKKEKSEVLESIKNNEIDIIIGTHALLESRVTFGSLGLVVIDEQHRFGVNQRKKIKEKSAQGPSPHLLSLSATPIPRSLSLTLYGDLDVSIIDELPPGRKRVITKIVPTRYREWTYDFIRKQIHAGRQVFIICPLIDLSDISGAKSVKAEYARLKKEVFPHLRLSMLHGKMKGGEKEHVMQGMLEGISDILVTTSVVEVGVDIPNASIMLVEGAERFGLAQLHQFRGRVGRSDYQSYCFLLPTSPDQEEVKRLKVVVSCSNGFELAEKDLALRGAGKLLGDEQSGWNELKIARLSDHELMRRTRMAAQSYAARIDEFGALRERVEHFDNDIHLE